LLAQHQYNEELLNLTNAERAAAGVPPLRLSTQLGQAAQAHAADMARNRTLSHQGSNGSSMVDRIEATGYDYRAIGENVACGNDSPAATIRQWMNSPGHRQNMLSPDFTEIGFGYADQGGSCTPYWAQVFGTPLQATQPPTPTPPAQAGPILAEQGSLNDTDGSLSDGSRFDMYQFEGRAGQLVTVRMSSAQFDTYLLVLDQAGTVLAQNDDVGPNDTNSVLSVTLPESGTYQVYANAYDANGRGTYELTVE
ncbi:MAG: CAP domain-containing protein, partial [Cyanobacteria bacterium P01_A01_bin.105]